MRSSVVDEKRLPGGESRVKYEAILQSHIPYTGQQTAKLPSRPLSRHLAPAEGWSPLLLLAIALYCVVSSIIAANWVSHSTILLWSPVVGLLVGIGVAKLPKLPQAALHLGACLLGHWFAIWLTSVVAFHINWVLVLGGLRAAITGSVTSGMVPSSEVVFFFYLAFLCFFLGYFGSWLVYRAHLPWLVALVYCSILLVNLNYVRKDLTYLVVILAGALILLIARVQLVTQIQRWVTEGLYTDALWVRSIVRRCMQVASVLTLLALLVSWLLPIQNQTMDGKAFWDQLDNAWNNILNGHASLQNIGSLTQPYQTPSNFFSDQLTISGSVRLPVGEVLYYTSTSLQPRYLEGFTYNYFDGHTWTTSLVNDAQTYYANASLPVDVDRADNTQITTGITVLQPPGGPKHYIFGPPQPISFNTPTVLYSDGMAGAWEQQRPLVKNEHYTVASVMTTGNSVLLSSVPLPSVAQDVWRNDKNYSTLTVDYMKIPQDLSPNVENVMKQWTQGSTNAYGALKMLETHLSDQATFTYSVNNPPIPANTDVIDWLLQTRSGYCTYYATAMAIMARQMGIPSRIVNGFSQGHFDPVRHVWSVDGQDAHSWVQAYLPDFGWVNFDPTPGFAPNAAPASHAKPAPTKAAARPAPVATPPPPKTTTKNQPHPMPQPAVKPPSEQHAKTQSVAINQNVLMGASILVLLLSLLAFLAAIVSYWWRNLYAENGFIPATFWRLCRIASWAGLAPRSSQTPYEYSNMLSNHFPQQASPLWYLTQLFVRERWGPGRQRPLVSEDETKKHLALPLRGLFLRLLLRRVKK
ncbi:MAG: DUF4129 domain-containing protein [Ktedonobacteraceae bacterium]|nr:DUF4129 domain-containing protein [Ktedonobacteraceae bacterium]